MKGKPVSTPSNHVEWANGFKSNMPDWITARECAHAESLLYALKRARVLLLACRQYEGYTAAEASVIVNLVQNTIDAATGMDTIGRDDNYIRGLDPLPALPKLPPLPELPR